MKKIIHKLLFLLAIYTMGTVLGLTLLILRLLGRIKVLHQERFPRYSKSPELFKNGLIVVSNHPSLLEPLIVSALFFDQYFVHPFRLSPWNVPEEKNYDNKFWKWAGARIIWVDRRDSRKARETFRKAKNVVNSGGILILFPEGGRTFKRKHKLSSRKDKEIGFLQEGIGLLLLRTKAPVLPIWVEGSDEVFPNTLWADDQTSKFPFPRFWKKITVKIGEVVTFEKTSREEITQEIALILLKLADEE